MNIRSRFPNHKNAYPTFSPANGHEYWPTLLRAGSQPFTPTAAARWKTQGKSLTHPARNGMNDPVSIVLVLDLILRLEPTTTIRSRDAAQLLNAHYPQVMWDTLTVGKILSSFAEAAASCGAPEGAEPIQKLMSDGTSIFVIQPSWENWRWLGQVRHALGEHAQQLVERERKIGRPEARPDFPWEIIQSIAWGTAQ